MGRYYRHPVAPIIDYSYKLPFQELFQAMQMNVGIGCLALPHLSPKGSRRWGVFQKSRVNLIIKQYL